MSVPTQLALVPFQGVDLPTARLGDLVYVAMKPIAEALGLDWRSQQAKLRRSGRYGDITIPMSTPGGVQDVLCIPIRKLNGWLFSINPDRVRDEIRERLIQYQEECFEVLFAYWTSGQAIRQAPEAGNEGIDVSIGLDLDSDGPRYTPHAFQHLMMALGGEYGRAMLTWKLLQMDALHRYVRLSLQQWVDQLDGTIVTREGVSRIIRSLQQLEVVQTLEGDDPKQSLALKLNRDGLQQLLDAATVLAQHIVARSDASIAFPNITAAPLTSIFAALRADQVEAWRNQSDQRARVLIATPNRASIESTDSFASAGSLSTDVDNGVKH